MNTETYTDLLSKPQQLNKEAMEQLEVVISKFPYFQSARALQLKALKNQSSFLYNDALKVTAAYTTNRDILFEFITSETFAQNEISQLIQQHDPAVNEIEVVSEDVSKQTATELDNQMKAELKKAEAILNPDLFERKYHSVEKLAGIPSEEETTGEPEATSSEKDKAEAEKTLELDKPIDFTKKDTHSFSEWLKLTQAKPIDRSAEKKTESQKVDESISEALPACIQEKKQETQTSDQERKFKMIEKFIQEKPKIKPAEQQLSKTNLAEPYTQTPKALMTETLAKVYLQQKNYKKAMQAYKILILKNPEKSGFFADQIRAIEKLIDTQ
ncbi:hypothetical protein [Marixanthomonas spongiae]|uniref:Uncharacterized protein n=1 Tax=Marixanthomonas spongiae TaxID=2174845 RepID=A0A2U0I7W9_9FLAO|nr:hypothetical protein [Marixanthomonas spongiae]PVW17202.1 hypothetical protein DDV96_01420 [Marixanthomonas spongiae]